MIKIFAVVPLLLGCQSQNSDLKPTTIRAFSIGHSLSSEIPDMVASLAANSGLKFSFQEQFRLGASLEFQYNKGSEGEAAKWDDGKFRTNYKSALGQGGFSALILIDSVPRGGAEQEKSSKEYLTKFVNFAAKSNPNAKFYFAEPWHSLKSGTGKAEWDTISPTRNLNWRKRVDADAPMWKRICEAASVQTGKRIILIPEAQAVASLVDAIEAGEIPGWSKKEDIFADDIHLNPYGMYFVACVQYGCLFGRSPEGITVDLKNRWAVEYWGKKHYFPRAFDRPNAEAVKKMQKIAWKFASTTLK
jgi:hypothetical protein